MQGINGSLPQIVSPAKTVLLLEVTGWPARLMDGAGAASGSGAEGDGAQSAGYAGFYSPVTEGYRVRISTEFATGCLGGRRGGTATAQISRL